ncbi:hypothetical protein LP7551_01467 [Roseibium album]|nr:hypothetical protein LP7551_01467 [Roseibium album]
MTARFSIVPAKAATDPELKLRDLQLLCILGRHTDTAGWCRRSQVKMAAEMGCCRATVYNSIKRLVQRGYVARVPAETASGRDSAHYYRVILDPKFEDQSAEKIDETAEGDTDEPLCQHSDTLVNTPAGPATSELAGPATSGLAPSITTPLNDPTSTERESAREEDEKETEPKVSRDAWKRRLRKLHARWPTFASDSADTAEIAWFALSVSEREQADTLLETFVAHVTGLGRTKHCAFAVYLREKRWQRLPSPAAKVVSSNEMAKPFGKLWGAMRFSFLICAPTGRLPTPTRYQQQILDQGGPPARAEELSRLARYGWPKVNDMQENAMRKGRSCPADPALQPLTKLFHRVRKGSDCWNAWRALHDEKGWPWFEVNHEAPEWIYLPKPPDDQDFHNELEAVKAALSRFEDEYASLRNREAVR